MDAETLQKELEEVKAELEKEREEKSKLLQNQSNQNSYITKLEEKANALAEQLKTIKETANKPALDPNITAYFKKKYIEDFIREGKEEIIARDTKGVFKLLEPELDNFLKAYMNENNASIKFVLDSYSLLLGRAISDPEHAINKLNDKDAKSENEEAQQQTESFTVKADFPPTLTDEDLAAGTVKKEHTPKVSDTKTAFKILEERLFNSGKNKFE